jgi:hypothetical protein
VQAFLQHGVPSGFTTRAGSREPHASATAPTAALAAEQATKTAEHIVIMSLSIRVLASTH